MYRDSIIRKVLSALAMLLPGLVAMQSCSLGMPAELKNSVEAMNLVGSKLDHPPFSGPSVILTSTLDGGQAVVMYPESAKNQPIMGAYYAFWVSQKTVYAVNRETMIAYPKLPQSPPEINTNRVIVAVAENNGVTLRPETETPGQ